MAGRMVEYLIALRDQFSAQAAKIAEASAAARKNVAGFGEAANAAEKGVANLAKGTAAAAAGMQNVANNASRAQSAFTGTGRAAAQSARELELWAKNAAKIEAMQVKMLNQQEAKKQLQESGLIPAGKEKPGLMSRGYNAFGAFIMGSMGVHAADRLLSRAGDVDALKNRMTMALGGDKEMVQRAHDKAFEMSSKYKNTSLAENLMIIDDLRANLPETMDHILKDSTEPFIRLHSFFKSLDGGKHAGKGHAALKDIGAAIRSGELIGQMTGEDLAAHARAIAVARIQFGDKFKVQEYFQATQKAMVPLTAANETFKHVDFPMMVQRMGINAGVAINSLNQKLVGGIRLRGAADAWERAEMIDPEFARTRLRRNKDGSIASKSLIGQKWIAGSDEMATNPLDWSVNHLLPGLERLGAAGVDAAKIKQSWKAGDFEKLTKLIKQISRTDMTRMLSGLGYDQNSVRALEALVVDLPSALRDRLGVQKAIKDTEAYDSYDKAKQRLGVQADLFWQSITGNNFMPWMTANLNKVAGGFTRLAESMRDPVFRDSVVDGAKFVGATGALMLLLGIVRKLGGGLNLLKRFTFAGAAIASAGFLVEHWEGISQRLKSIWTDMATVFSSVFDGKSGTTSTALENLGKNVDSQLDRIGEKMRDSGYFDWLTNQMNRMEPADYARMYPYEGDREARRGMSLGSMAPANYNGEAERVGGFSRDLVNSAAQRVMVESTVRTTIDPIQVQAPASIEVRVTGTVNGQVNGTGAIPITTNSPRGQSAADPVAPKVSN